ncbi:MAG: tetratricopeptide repeat protein [Pseudomonadota bacterium]
MSRIVNLALNAADHLVSKGRLDAAASILRNYLSTNDANPRVLQRLGRIYLKQGRSAEAVPLFQEALVSFQKDAPAVCRSCDDPSCCPGDTPDTAATQPDLVPRFIASL